MKTFWQSLPKPILALAPMEGWTDAPFRQICRAQGADVVYTEFLSSDAIGHGATAVLANMRFDPSEQPVICQIFGHDIDMFRAAAVEVERRGFAGIDINFGCPARKVVAHGSGVALLRDPQYARQLIETVLDATKLPVSIKVRTSIRKERKEIAPGTQERYTALDLLGVIQDLPVAAIMVHGRSYEGGFSGTVDTDMIRQVKGRFTGIVLANGGIQSPEDAKQLLNATGADGVGIARGSQGAPWIFQQARSLLDRGTYDPVPWEAIRGIMLDHARRMEQDKGTRGMLRFRKHLAAYVRGFPGASQLRRTLVRTQSVDDIEKALPHALPSV
ncbi:MAG: tRNA-dihydrouridine synthase [Candidatus Kerfeldbacteria bacterium]|nr:tRNA-dihydrouridine synthase [Candidatus Kerfeldbacteria bacterium]